MNKFEVDVKEILDSKLGFESYFVLYCLYKKDKELITSYIRQCKKINTDIFNQLAIDDYILINNQNINEKIYFENLSLLKKGKLLFDKLTGDSSVESEFNTFKNNYPSITKGGRRLHTNLRKCKELFSKIIKEIPIETLSKCARLYALEKQRTNSEEYMQLLITWLSQRNYEQYIDSIETQDEQKRTNYTAI